MIEFTDKGLFCPAGGFYIDPWKPVERAVITHAHSDHARPGSRAYLCHRLTVPLLALRLGPGVAGGAGGAGVAGSAGVAGVAGSARSEERRVGKECW